MNCKGAQNTLVNYVSHDPASLEIIIILNFRYLQLTLPKHSGHLTTSRSIHYII